MSVSLVIRATTSVGIFGSSGGVPTNQPPTWQLLPNTTYSQGFAVGEIVNINLDTLWSDPEGLPLTYTITQGSLPTGLTQSGTRGQTISGTVTAASVFTLSIRADDTQPIIDPEDPPPDETDWGIVSALSDMRVLENFSTYANRKALLDHYEIVDQSVGNRTQNTFYPGYTSANKYLDPIPNGSVAKLDLDFTNFITGSKALKCIMPGIEGESEAGPSIEIPLTGTPPSIWYVRIVYRVDNTALTFDYGGSHRKIVFLNHFGPGAGQIVGVLRFNSQPWVTAYRYTGGARIFALDHGASIGGLHTQIFGGIDQGGATPTTANQWDARYGPSRENTSPTDSDYAFVNRPVADQWYVSEWMMDITYPGTFSQGLFKTWGAAYGSAPQLQCLNMQDCDFRDGAQPETVRPIFRPEDPTWQTAPRNDVIGDSGIIFDSIAVRANLPIPFPGGFSLPYDGRTIPPGHPTFVDHDGNS